MRVATLILGAVLIALFAAACEKNNDLIALEQIQDSQNACPKGCETSLPGCVIKGNISSGGAKIYHVVGSSKYDGVKILPDQGERWFCNEAEARRNGWVRSAD